MSDNLNENDQVMPEMPGGIPAVGDSESPLYDFNSAISPIYKYRWVYWLVGGWLLTTTLAAGGFLCGVVLVVILIIALFLMMLAVIPLFWKRNELPLLATIRSAVSRSMPLEPVLMAYSQEVGSMRLRRRMQLLCMHLLSGKQPFPEALANAGGLVRGRTLYYLWAGRETGKQPEVIDRLCLQIQDEEQRSGFIAFKLQYLLFIFCVFSVSSSFYLMFIAPKIQEINDEFGITQHGMTGTLYSIIDQFTHMFITMSPLFSLGFMAIAGFVLLLLLRYIYGVRWVPPGLRPLFVRSESPDVLQVMGDFVKSGKSIESAFDFLAYRYHLGWMRRRLGRMAIKVNQGMPWQKVLFQGRIINASELALLDAAQRNGNLGSMLSEVGRSIGRRFNDKASMLIQLVFTGLILLAGLVTLVLALQMFAGIVQLISELS